MISEDDEEEDEEGGLLGGKMMMKEALIMRHLESTLRIMKSLLHLTTKKFIEKLYQTHFVGEIN